MLRVGRGSCALLGVAMSLPLLATTARAQSSASDGARAREQDGALDVVIELERAAGAEACPDTESVFRAMQRLFPERSLRQSTSSNQSAASARVVIRPLVSGYEAVMTVLRPRPGERVILEKEADCRGLADALALAFVMLVEPPATNTAAGDAAGAVQDEAATNDAAATPEPAPSASSAAPPPAPPAATKAATASPRGPAFRADVGAAAVGGVGLLTEPAGGVTGRLDFFHRSGWGATLEGMRLWSKAVDGEGGSVRLTQWALAFGPYYRAQLTKRSSLAAGVLVGIGRQAAHVENFVPTPSASGTFPWSVLVPEAVYRLAFGSAAGAFAGLGPVIQLKPQSFSVTEQDTGRTVEIAAAPRFGARAEIGISLGADVF